MNKYKISFILVSLFLAVSCNKRMSDSYGRIDKTYSCLSVMPFANETSFSPMDQLLEGYLNLAMYQSGLQEIMSPDDLSKIFKEDGGVYFPTSFNEPLAIEYSSLLGLDGVFFGRLASPERARSNVKGETKPFSLEVYFLDVRSSSVSWSYTRSGFLTPGDYNDDLKAIAKDVVNSLKRSGFKYLRTDMPCWDSQLASYLRRMPDITKEMFNSLTLDLAGAKEDDLRMDLGNIFMTIGKRSLALNQYRQYLRQNPASPFKDEVLQQVAVITRSIR